MSIIILRNIINSGFHNSIEFTYALQSKVLFETSFIFIISVFRLPLKEKMGSVKVFVYSITFYLLIHNKVVIVNTFYQIY